MQSMQALVLTQPGERPIFEFQKISLPKPARDEVLIETHTVSINPIDVKTAMGGGLYEKLKSEKPLILGWDIAGIVVDKGSDVTSFSVGDRVFGMVKFPELGQTLADFVCAPASHVTALPPNSTFAEGAACSLAALTAYQALIQHMNLKSGMHILIHAAAGGVGHIAVQIAVNQGATVWATCSPSNATFVKQCGASVCIDYINSGLENINKKFDAILDCVGFDYIRRSVQWLKPNGILVSLPSISSHLLDHVVKHYGIKGVFFRVESNISHLQTIAHMLHIGVLRPFVEKLYVKHDFMLAFSHVQSGHTRGKVVIQWKE